MLIPTTFTRRTFDETEPVFREKQNLSFDRGQQPILDIFHRPQPSFSSGTGPNSSMTTLLDDREIRMIRGPTPEPSEAMTTLKHGIFKWPGHRMRDQTFASSDPRSKRHFEHNFQPANALRFTRCDHCGEKLRGGSHFRCTSESSLSSTSTAGSSQLLFSVPYQRSFAMCQSSPCVMFPASCPSAGRTEWDRATRFV